MSAPFESLTLLFLFDLFLEARAEMLEMFLWFFEEVLILGQWSKK